MSDLNALPDTIRVAVQNNGGGHANHSLFWTILSPEGGGAPDGDLGDAINEAFDSFDSFKDIFTATATARFGSGWVWLSMDNNNLIVESTPYQNTPLSEGRVPILGLDVWEHAYYLKYQNRRKDYIEAFWNIINWQEVSNRMHSD